jgi:hypothetical protein
VDAYTWKAPSRKSIRLDFVAAKRPPLALAKAYAGVRRGIRGRL